MNIAQFCQDNGCELLKTWIQSKRTRIQYKCKCGNVAEAYWCNYKRYPNCKKCGADKMRGDKCHMYDPDRDAVAMRKKFRKACEQHIRRFMKSTSQKKTRSTHELLGYTPQQLQEHIVNHPDYNKCKNDYHVDHIFPIKAFLDHGVFDLKLINHLDNLRPMPGTENLSKADSYDTTAFLEWIHGETNGLQRIPTV